MMKRLSTLLLLGSLLLTLFVLSACTTAAEDVTLSDADTLATAQASVPLPTQMSGQGLTVAQNDACLVKEDTSISVDTPQGDLLAWSPVTDELAYVRPDNGRWAWFVGEMVAYDFGLAEEVYVSSDLAVYGDLTWAPDGSALAYVVLDQSAKIYTVHVADMLTGTDINIFTGTSARTDDWSSTKGVTNWPSERNVVVISSCGADCARIYNYNTESGVITIDGEERKSEDPSLTLTNEMTSPDGIWQFTVDTNDNLWLTNLETGKAFVLVAATTVEEIKWAIDSRYVALRTAEKVLVYQVGCKK